MLFGDNLLDFTDPKKSTAKEREKLVQKHEKDFGKSILFSQIQCMEVGNRHFIIINTK